jgi:hypothetical protein
MSDITDDFKQNEERDDEVYEFMKKNYVETSTDQHCKDAREFVVYIKKIYDAFNNVRSEFMNYIRTNQISNKETLQILFRETLISNSEYIATRLELVQYCDKFLQEERDEFSVVKKIIKVYQIVDDNKKINLKNLKEVEQIKEQLEFYLTGDVETMCNGDPTKIEEFNRLKQFSIMANNFLKNRNNEK